MSRPMGGRPRRLTSAANAGWAAELDFVGPRVATASWAWILCLAGLAAMAAVWPQVQEVDDALGNAQHDVRRLERATQQAMQRAPGLAGAASRSDPAWPPEAVLAATRVTQALAYPWSALLDQVESKAQAHHALMLSLSADRTSLDPRKRFGPDVRMSAAVQGDDPSLQWAEAHGPTAQLTLREKLPAPLDTAWGIYAWRAEAIWVGATP